MDSQLTLFAPASHAKTYQSDIPGASRKCSQESEADCGERSSGLLMNFGLSSSSAKMSPPCALEDLHSACKIYGRSGMTRSGILFQLPALALTIRENASGLLPTPRASEWKGCGPKGSKSHDQWMRKFYLSAIVTDSGKLNPMFAELLMGFPAGWTDLKQSETQ
jgi:hypothetical protein